MLAGVSQAAGFVKLWMIARLFGIGAELDGYTLALVIPAWITGVLSAALQTGLFPVRARLAAQGDTERLARFERLVLFAMLALGSVIALAIVSVAPLLIAGLASQASAPVREALAFVLPYAALLVVLNAVGDSLGYFLAMRDRYWVAAAAPIANAILGAILLAAWPEGGLLNLALGTVLGLILQIAICCQVLRGLQFQLVGPLPTRAEATAKLRDILRLGVWILPAAAFSNLAAALPPVLIASYGEGAIAAFGYAYRLHTAAVQLLVISVSPVILQRFSEIATHGDWRNMRRVLASAAWLSLAIGFGATAGVFFFGASILEVIFMGRFDALAADRVGDQWLWLSCGLGFTIFGGTLARFWQATAHSHLLSLFGATQLVAFLAIYELVDSYGEQSVSMAMSSALLVVVVANVLFLPQRLRDGKCLLASEITENSKRSL